MKLPRKLDRTKTDALYAWWVEYITAKSFYTEDLINTLSADARSYMYLYATLQNIYPRLKSMLPSEYKTLDAINADLNLFGLRLSVDDRKWTLNDKGFLNVHGEFSAIKRGKDKPDEYRIDEMLSDVFDKMEKALTQFRSDFVNMLIPLELYQLFKPKYAHDKLMEQYKCNMYGFIRRLEDEVNEFNWMIQPWLRLLGYDIDGVIRGKHEKPTRKA